jgi:hypothetical protein
LAHSITERASPRQHGVERVSPSEIDPDTRPAAATNDDADGWTPSLFSQFVSGLRAAQEAERRAAFRPLGAPPDCLWPASRVFHEHSKLWPGWMPVLSVEQIEALTRNLDFKRYPGAVRTRLPQVPPIQADLGRVIHARRSRHDFAQRPLALDEVAMVLSHSCGVTEDGANTNRWLLHRKSD